MKILRGIVFSQVCNGGCVSGYDVAHVPVERHRQQISTRAYRLVLNIGPLVHYRHEIRTVSVVTVENALCLEFCMFRLPLNFRLGISHWKFPLGIRIGNSNL